MKRRNFLTKAGLAATASALSCGGSVDQSNKSAAIHTLPSLTWRLASSFPQALDTIYGAAELMASRVAELTANKFQIIAYDAGELVPALQVLDAVQQGTVQMGHTASYYYKGKNPVLAFDCTVPFGLTARQQNAWFYYGGGLDHMRRAFSDFGIINFPGGNTGMQMGGWFREEIANLQDLKGLRMRIPGLGGEVMHRLGVTVQVLGGGDIFPALERGAIDATEWVGPYDDEKLGFHKIVSHYYYPGWWEPGPSLSFYVNRSDWDKLPSLYQQAIEVASAEANVQMLASYDAKNPPALGRLIGAGVKLRAFSDDILAAAQKSSFEIMDEFAAQDPAYANVYNSWKKSREESYLWFSTAEMAFAKFAFADH